MQHKVFVLTMLIAYVLTILISANKYIQKHPCKDQTSLLIESKPENNVVVLIWETENHWTGWGRNGYINWAGYTDSNTLRCRETCVFTSDQSLYQSSDVVLFEPQPHGKRGLEYPPRKICGQKYMMFSYETSKYFEIQADPKYLSKMDWKMTFDAKAEVQISLTCSWGQENGIESYRRRIPPLKEKKKFAVFVASNCKRGGADKRTAYVKELMKYIQVDSYGKCLMNQPADALNRNTDRDRFTAKMELFKQYKFVLAFENSNETDYVTEKLPHAYLGLSLPVYMGAPNVEDWTTGDNSIIRTDQFASPKALGQYLVKVSKNETLYNSYFKWKNAPLKESFHRHYNNCVFLAECNSCPIELEQQQVLLTTIVIL
ncbi:hypothetical protein SAMD00019534_065210 [Acytostelium subglobosum LB1]|uniref:hypothetical protein n=1 Tax=Acytostelium subglobosum LB1 TaxID=1410327 RepID=UPI0006449436|nr:hypothetical protein SAMD00019534_065210 [Acytostelium subglobosum LB1]GAM23346.1 hypothetical protein SAMD00019534_065210 [Acytostelium subglobosum LB1]|eukprot:XP_012753795.1 hypothetical protein SAMD00019534_065210 [Acytostelium subglobosum LB1]